MHAPYHQHIIEMVQRQAARFVTSNYDRTASVTEMLHSLKWSKYCVVLLFKIINKLVDMQPEEQLLPTNSIT